MEWVKLLQQLLSDFSFFRMSLPKCRMQLLIEDWKLEAQRRA